MALRGSCHALLPERAGQAAYRVSPGITISGQDLPSTVAACICHLRSKTSNLRDIAAWCAIDPQWAT